MASASSSRNVPSLSHGSKIGGRASRPPRRTLHVRELGFDEDRLRAGARDRSRHRGRTLPRRGAGWSRAAGASRSIWSRRGTGSADGSNATRCSSMSVGKQLTSVLAADALVERGLLRLHQPVAHAPARVGMRVMLSAARRARRRRPSARPAATCLSVDGTGADRRCAHDSRSACAHTSSAADAVRGGAPCARRPSAAVDPRAARARAAGARFRRELPAGSASSPPCTIARFAETLAPRRASSPPRASCHREDRGLHSQHGRTPERNLTILRRGLRRPSPLYLGARLGPPARATR